MAEKTKKMSTTRMYAFQLIKYRYVLGFAGAFMSWEVLLRSRTRSMLFSIGDEFIKNPNTREQYLPCLHSNP